MIGSSALNAGLLRVIVVSGRIFRFLPDELEIEPPRDFRSLLEWRVLDAIDTEEDITGSVALSFIGMRKFFYRDLWLSCWHETEICFRKGPSR